MPFLNTAAILVFLAAFVGLVIIWTGVRVVMASQRTKMADHGRTSGNIGIGVAIMALGVIFLGGTGILYTFRDAIAAYTTFKP